MKTPLKETIKKTVEIIDKLNQHKHAHIQEGTEIFLHGREWTVTYYEEEDDDEREIRLDANYPEDGYANWLWFSIEELQEAIRLYPEECFIIKQP